MKMIDKDGSGEVDVDEMVVTLEQTLVFSYFHTACDLQVAYFLQSAEMASDEKFEEKMKVLHVLNGRSALYIVMTFSCRTSEPSSPILSLKIDDAHLGSRLTNFDDAQQ
jgi:hypothetical protein